MKHVRNSFQEKFNLERERSRKNLEEMLNEDPSEIASLFQREPEAFADIMARASADLARGGMDKKELSSLAEAFANQPELLSKLLSGLGA